MVSFQSLVNRANTAGVIPAESGNVIKGPNLQSKLEELPFWCVNDTLHERNHEYRKVGPKGLCGPV